MKNELYDSIIVGGGPAGLSAALILGRCLRNVLVFDSETPRNAYAKNLHAFLTRDNIPPQEFKEIALKDLERYETVKFIKKEITSAKKHTDYFLVTDLDGNIYHSKTLLIATGVMDDIPQIEGFMDLYGKSVFTCPYCDAWEVRGKQIGVYGKDGRGFGLSLPMKNWSNDIVLFTDGTELNEEQLQKLAEKKIRVRTEKISRILGKDGKLQEIELENGEVEKRDALFFNTPSFIRSKLLEQLGCPFTNEDGVETGKYERTEVPGLFVAGNILREVQLVIVAAAEGAEAAFGINKTLNQIST